MFGWICTGPMSIPIESMPPIKPLIIEIIQLMACLMSPTMPFHTPLISEPNPENALPIASMMELMIEPTPLKMLANHAMMAAQFLTMAMIATMGTMIGNSVAMAIARITLKMPARLLNQEMMPLIMPWMVDPSILKKLPMAVETVFHTFPSHCVICPQCWMAIMTPKTTAAMTAPSAI